MQHAAVSPVGRAGLGIPESTLVFGTGVTALECRYELLVSWSRILAEVPDAILLMFPFEADRIDDQTVAVRRSRDADRDPGAARVGPVRFVHTHS